MRSSLLRRRSEIGAQTLFRSSKTTTRYHSRPCIDTFSTCNHFEIQSIFPVTCDRRCFVSTDVSIKSRESDKNSLESPYEKALSELSEGSQLHLDFFGEPGTLLFRNLLFSNSSLTDKIGSNHTFFNVSDLSRSS